MWYKTAQNDTIHTHLNIYVSDDLKLILQELKSRNTPGLIVGGAVRDALLGLNPKDIDIEVYNTDYASLSNVLSKYGKISISLKNY